jgi:hypothetical protein
LAPPVPVWSYMRGSSKICRPPMVGDDDEDQGGAQARHRDREELAHLAGAVDGRGLVVVARDGLHRRQQDEGVVAGPRKFTIVAIAMWLAKVSGMPHDGDADVEPVLMMPYWSPNMFEKIRATATEP